MIDNEHDLWVQRFSAIWEPVIVRKLNALGHAEPWVTLNAQDVLPELVIKPSTLRMQADTIALQIGWWSRMAAHAQRMVDVQERHLRAWQAEFELELAVSAKASAGKAPTRSHVEASYRTVPRYAELYSLVEEATEAAAFCEGMCGAFKEKSRILIADIRRVPDGTLDRWSP